MKTTGRSDSSLPTAEAPRSLEAMTSVAPMLASEVISSSGADGDPRKMAPSSSSIPTTPQAFFPNAVLRRRNEPDRQQRAERELPGAKRRQIEHEGRGFDS